jgi:long-chain acyl-CoA synthetase
LLPRFAPEGLLRAIEQHRLTHLHMVPTMFIRLLKLPQAVRERYDLSSLELVVHGAAPCPPEVKRRMLDWWGPVIREYYGSTEAGIVSVVDADEWLARPGTVGRPIAGTRVAVYDENAHLLPAGESGEIYMTLNAITDFTYHNADEKRREIARGDMVTNGDVGCLDADGYLFLNDRKRDMVISGGVNIYPAEIEATLHNMPGVHDCAVFGIPDDEYGEALAAAVQASAGADLNADKVRAYLREHLAGYKVPRVVTFHASLPREDSGKIFKRRLREPYWSQSGRKI